MATLDNAGSVPERFSRAVWASGQTVPCRRGDRWWTSDEAGEREKAVAGCLGCPEPVRTACRALADDQRAVAGVWGGVDYTQTGNQTWRNR